MPDPSPIIHVDILGKMGNRMMQYLTAYSIARQVTGCRLSNIDIAEWEMTHVPIAENGAYKLSITYADEQQNAGKVETDNLVKLFRDGGLRRLVLSGYCQNVANFGHVEECRKIFSRSLAGSQGYGSEELLINIRMGDIANGHHRDYVLLPVDFYSDVVRASGLRPVFLGQIEDNIYCRQLRTAFPKALFINSRGAAHDFECIRRSKNILLSISTFSWMAAWLSDAERIIMPVVGMFHPMQHPSSNLIPTGDPRYMYYLFPIHHAVPVAEVLERHAMLHGLWRLVGGEQIAGIGAGPRFQPQKSDFAHVFDERYYLQTYADIKASVERHGLPSGLVHFVASGFDEHRKAFDIDDQWYFRNYLTAAMEVGQGDYLNAAHHYAAVGAARGYSPTPSLEART